jgi:sugar phosphate isomerase/epimerase
MRLGFMNLMTTKNILDDVEFAIKNNFNAFGIGLDWEQNWNLKPQTIKKIKELSESNNIQLDIHSAYFLATSAIHPDIRKTVIKVLKYSIIIANKVDSHSITVHPGYRESIDDKKNYDVLKETLKTVVKFGENYDVKVCLENHAIPISPCFYVDDLLKVLKSVEGLKATLDIGHTNLTNISVAEYYKKIKDFVINVHVHDNDGTSDQHRCIGEGNINFNSALKEFKKNKYDGPFILEIFTYEKLIKSKEIFLRIWNEV